MLSEEEMLTYEQYRMLSYKERNKYIKNLYASGTPKILGEITSNIGKFFFAKVLYMVFENKRIAVSPAFFSDYEENLGQSVAIKTNEMYAMDYLDAHNLKKGDYILVKIKTSDDRHLKEGRCFEGICDRLKKVSLESFELVDNDLIYFLKNEDGHYTRAVMEEGINELFQKKQQDYDAYIESLRTQKETEIQLLEGQLQEMQGKLAFYEKAVEEIYRDVYDPVSVANPPEYIEKNNMEEYIEAIRTILAERFHLFYSRQTLLSFYIGLQSNQLMLLTGNPGCGKSSLVRHLPKVFGFRDAVFIPVQSNWDNKNNLLGYYNPLEKKYVPELFLSELMRLVRAAENAPEELFFICLEEMNLAHIEHYFADFLSILQDTRILKLYPKDIYDEIQAEINAYDSRPKTERLTLEEERYAVQIEAKRKMLIKYPEQIIIPKNLRFIGTLNQDETTLDLSPKILNRSYVVKMKTEEFSIEDTQDNVEESYVLKYKGFEGFGSSENITLEYEDNIVKDEITKRMSYRLREQFMKNTNLGIWNSLGMLREYYDNIIAATILPSIRESDEDRYDETVEQINKLLAHFAQNATSSRIFNEMNNPEEREIYYWKK